MKSVTWSMWVMDLWRGERSSGLRLRPQANWTLLDLRAAVDVLLGAHPADSKPSEPTPPSCCGGLRRRSNLEPEAAEPPPPPEKASSSQKSPKESS